MKKLLVMGLMLGSLFAMGCSQFSKQNSSCGCTKCECEKCECGKEKEACGCKH